MPYTQVKAASNVRADLTRKNMKIDFDAPIIDLDGKPMQDTDKKGFPPLTLKDACLKAIRTPLQEDQGLVGETAFKRLELARKIKAGGEQEDRKSTRLNSSH